MKMKKMNEYKVDVVAGTITLTKRFAKAAGVLGTREFNTFKQLRADYPDYAVQVREIAKKENKTSYANLTYDFMKTYIRTIEGETSENLVNLEKVIELSKGQAGRYAYVKTWFLGRYPKYQDVLATMNAIA